MNGKQNMLQNREHMLFFLTAIIHLKTWFGYKNMKGFCAGLKNY